MLDFFFFALFCFLINWIIVQDSYSPAGMYTVFLMTYSWKRMFVRERGAIYLFNERVSIWHDQHINPFGRSNFFPRILSGRRLPGMRFYRFVDPCASPCIYPPSQSLDRDWTGRNSFRARSCGCVFSLSN